MAKIAIILLIAATVVNCAMANSVQVDLEPRQRLYFCSIFQMLLGRCQAFTTTTARPIPPPTTTTPAPVPETPEEDEDEDYEDEEEDDTSNGGNGDQGSTPIQSRNQRTV